MVLLLLLLVLVVVVLVVLAVVVVLLVMVVVVLVVVVVMVMVVVVVVVEEEEEEVSEWGRLEVVRVVVATIKLVVYTPFFVVCRHPLVTAIVRRICRGEAVVGGRKELGKCVATRPLVFRHLPPLHVDATS